jgi:hypothetical protein
VTCVAAVLLTPVSASSCPLLLTSSLYVGPKTRRSKYPNMAHGHVPGRPECNTLSHFKPVSIKKTVCLQSICVSPLMGIISRPIFSIFTGEKRTGMGLPGRTQRPRGLRHNCLRSLERWDRGFESHSGHVCLRARLFCLHCSVCR